MSTNRGSSDYARAADLFLQAVELPVAERNRFLAEACAGNEQLRERVEALLASDGEGCLLDGEEGPGQGERDQMAGREIGRYRILKQIGEGGMAVVYRAEDRGLDRSVALKFLSPLIAVDEESRARFVREAKAAAAIDHPNVCPVYEINTDGPRPFLVMAYLEGKTLADLLSGGPLDVRTTMDIAVQVCRGLEAAHQKGVVHRDIKPANLMVSQTSTRPLVRILDFGIARIADLSAMTQPGLTVGTVAYMAPEQIESANIDGRADLWALGVVCYRMLAGKLPFTRATARETLAAIAQSSHEPLSTVRPGVPLALSAIVDRALAKDVEQRYQTATELLHELEELQQSIESGERVAQTVVETVAAKEPKRGLLPVFGLIVGAILLGYSAWRLASGPAAPAGPLVPERFTAYPGSETGAVISPDGTRVAFIWDGETTAPETDIYVKLIGSESRHRVTRSPGAKHSLAWSPDGTRLAYILGGVSPRKVLVVPALGGPATEVAAVDGVGASALDWSPGGDLLAVSGREGIFLISLRQHTTRRLTFPAAGESDKSPRFSPGGEQVIFARTQPNRTLTYHAVSIDGGQSRLLGLRQEAFQHTAEHGVAVHPLTGDIVFPAASTGPGGALMKMAMSGDKPRRAPIAELSATGPHMRDSTLVYSRHELVTNILALQLTGDGVAEAGGRFQPLIVSSVRDDSPAFSPDGRMLAFSSDRSGAREIWRCDRNGHDLLQLTASGGMQSSTPSWSPDGQWIAFEDDNQHLWIVSANGGKARPLTTGEQRGWFPQWSQDGRWVYFTWVRDGRENIWKIPAAGGEVVQVTKHGALEGMESRDGRCFYYSEPRFPRRIHRLRLDSGADEIVPGVRLIAGGRRYWALAQNGIYYLSGGKGEEVRYHSFATGTNVRVAAAGTFRPGPKGLAVSPDGRTLLFSHLEKAEADIMLVRELP